jgi:AAA15 family ATPase/GTPase
LIKGPKEEWRQLTKSNTLFLSEAMRGNAQSESLVKPFEWIQNVLRIINSPEQLSYKYSADQYLDNEHYKQKIQSLLDSTDTRIKSLEIEKEVRTLSDFPEVLLENAPPEFLEDLKNGKVTNYKITTVREDNLGNAVKLNFREESDGIQTLFRLAGPWFNVLEKGCTLVVDELHNSFHPHALRFLVNLFYDPEINKKNAQLIFTSHETSIMNNDILHRDQIWFMQRKENQQSELYSLAEYTNEKAMSNFQKAYLSGRYDALPKLKVLDYGL